MDFEQILTLLITAVIVPLLTWGVKTLVALLDAKIALIKDRTIAEALSTAKYELEKAVELAVSETQETFVKSIKAEGKFDAKAAQDAFNRSFDRTKEIMSNAGMNVIETATGALNAMITAQIEKAVAEIKVVG